MTRCVTAANSSSVTELTRSRSENPAFKGGIFPFITVAFRAETFQLGEHAPELAAPAASDKPKLLAQVRDVIRRKRFSLRTGRTYCDLIRRFILYHGKRHPREMAEAEITEFLTHLARFGLVAEFTQNQA